MKEQRVVGKRKNNPVAKQLSDPLWKMRVVKSKMIYNRKIKHEGESK
jgi:stalled ribosome alternative rescue factor ArfA